MNQNGIPCNGENLKLQNQIQLIEDLLHLTDENPSLQTSILGKLGILYEHSMKKNLAIDNILSVQKEIDKLKMQFLKESYGCYTDISSDSDSLPPSPEKQLESKSSNEASIKGRNIKKSKRYRPRSSKNHHSDRRSRSKNRDRGRRHRNRHSKCESTELFPERQFQSRSSSEGPEHEHNVKRANRLQHHSPYSTMKRNKHNPNSKRCSPSRSRDRRKRHRKRHRNRSDDSDAEKYSTLEDLASYSNSHKKHRGNGVDYKMKNKYGRLVKSSSSHRYNEKTNVSSNCDSTDSMSRVKKRISSTFHTTKLSEAETDKSVPKNLRDQLARILESIVREKNTSTLKMVVSPTKNIVKNTCMLSEHATRKKTNETKVDVEWVDSFDILLAEEIIDDEVDDEIDDAVDDEIDDAVDNEIDDDVDNEIDDEVDDEIDDEVDDEIDDEVDDEIIRKIVAGSSYSENKASSIKHDSVVSSNKSVSDLSFDTELVKQALATVKKYEQYEKNEGYNPEPPNVVEHHVQSPFTQSNSLQLSNDPRLQRLRVHDQREGLHSNSMSNQDYASLNYGSLPQSHKIVTSPTYSYYKNPLKWSNEEYFDTHSSSACFKKTETRMTCISSETRFPNRNNSKSNLQRDQRVNYSTYGEYRRSLQPICPSTSTNTITETAIRPLNTDPRLGYVSRSGNNAMLNSKTNFEIKKAAIGIDGSVEVHTPELVNKQSNLRWSKGSDDSKSQKSVNIQHKDNRCNNSRSTNFNQSSNNSTHSQNQRNLEPICSSTPLNFKDRRNNVFNNNSKSIPKSIPKFQNFRIPKKTISKTLEMNEANDFYFDHEKAGSSESETIANITETNSNSNVTVENTEPQISMQTIVSTSKLYEKTRTTSSEKENNVVVSSSSTSVDLTENRDAIAVVKELIGPRYLRTIIELIGVMKSLPGVQEIIEKHANDAAAVGTESSYSSVDIKNTSVPKPKTRKNELDRLHEDINTMFIRDDVLNATGRRFSASAKKIATKSVDDFDIGKNEKKKLLRPRSNTMVAQKIQHGQANQPSIKDLKSTALKSKLLRPRSNTMVAPKIQHGQHNQPSIKDLKSIALKSKLLRPRSNTMVAPKIQHGQHNQPSIKDLKSTALFKKTTTINQPCLAGQSTKSQRKEKIKHPRYEVVGGQDNLKKSKIKVMILRKKKKKIEFEDESENEYDEDYRTESGSETESESEEKSEKDSDGDYEWELDEKYAKQLDQEYREELRIELEEEEYLEEQLAKETTEASSDEEYEEKNEDNFLGDNSHLGDNSAFKNKIKLPHDLPTPYVIVISDNDE